MTARTHPVKCLRRAVFDNTLRPRARFAHAQPADARGVGRASRVWPDALALAEKVRRTTGRCELHDVHGGCLAYMHAAFLPESQATYRALAAALR